MVPVTCWLGSIWPVRSTVIVSASSYRDSRGQQKRSCVVAISVEGPSKVLQLESSCINLLPQSPADIVKERRDNAAVLHFEAIGMELLESMVVNRSPGKKRNLPHSNDGGAVDAAIIVAGGLCCGTLRRHRAEHGRHPQCVQASGCRLRGTGISSGTRHSAAMMIGAILVISRWLLIGFLLLRCSSSSQAAQVRFQSSHSLRARRN